MAFMGYDVIHLGGRETVTGSCHLLQVSGLNILVDCGLAQGHDRVVSMADWPLPVREIDYLFLTHAHLDHIGRVPELLEAGFKGEILCTHATKVLLEPLLRDALGFTDWPRKKVEDFLVKLDEMAWGFEYRQAFSLRGGVSFKFGVAGHILGSCFIILTCSEYLTVVFSGDLGALDTPLLPDPDICEPCDLLVLESTYGDRLHGDRKGRVARLKKGVERALADGGKIFIPAFALGRTQELIYEFDRIFADGKSIPVFVDTPLGLKITEAYANLREFWDREALALLRGGDDPLDFARLYGVERHCDHRQLLELDGPAIILAGSGMCSGGRIVEHLKNGIEDRRNDIFFVGYQAFGTPGRDILRYSRRPGGYVVFDGKRYEIRAGVEVLTGYSAHADQLGLLDWVGAMAEKPGEIRLVHGEVEARRGLRGALQEIGLVVGG